MSDQQRRQDNQPEPLQHDRQVVRPPRAQAIFRLKIRLIELLIDVLWLYMRERMRELNAARRPRMPSAILQGDVDEEESFYTSILTGEAWVKELLAGRTRSGSNGIRRALGMRRRVFVELLAQLRLMGNKNSKNISLQEQVAIFLYTCVTGLAIPFVAERFQRPKAVISHYFQKILFAFTSSPFYTTYVRLPTADDPVPPEIRHDPKFFPFFKDCLGVLDGVHIPSLPPKDKQPVWRNRKGFYSQNCLFGCSFDRTFVYSMAGWEGSTTDAHVYKDARSSDLNIPEGKYYLADPGYYLTNELLVPYPGVRYYLAEWGDGIVRPSNKEELFNLRHASVRNIILQTLGALKRRFRILRLEPEPDYSIDIQARIPVALCAIHNFIAKHDPSEEPLPENSADYCDGYYDDVNFAGVTRKRKRASDATVKRDQIAEMMWQSYQQERERFNQGISSWLQKIQTASETA